LDGELGFGVDAAALVPVEEREREGRRARSSLAIETSSQLSPIPSRAPNPSASSYVSTSASRKARITFSAASARESSLSASSSIADASVFSVSAREACSRAASSTLCASSNTVMISEGSRSIHRKNCSRMFGSSK